MSANLSAVRAWACTGSNETFGHLFVNTVRWPLVSTLSPPEGSLGIIGYGVGTEVLPNPARVVSDEAFREPRPWSGQSVVTA